MARTVSGTVSGRSVKMVTAAGIHRASLQTKKYVAGLEVHVMLTASSYANFNFQGDFGVQIRMRHRVDLRLEPVVYFHVSNGYFAASNPGFDQLGGKFGLSYHLRKKGGR